MLLQNSRPDARSKGSCDMWKPRFDPRLFRDRLRRVGRLERRNPAGWIAAALLVVVAVAYAVAYLMDEPLRRSIESRMNARLKGYTVRLGKADFHPIGLSLDLRNITVVQDANPDPPVMQIHRLGASVQWREFIHARLVADMVLDRPVLYVNLAHLKQEAKEQVPVKERGWQDALQEAYPLKINEFRVFDGEVTYVDPAQPFKPLRLSRLFVDADNIRNVKSE